MHCASTRRTVPAYLALCGIGIPSPWAGNARATHANKLAGKAQAARRALLSSLASSGALCAALLFRGIGKPSRRAANARVARANKFTGKARAARRALAPGHAPPRALCAALPFCCIGTNAISPPNAVAATAPQYKDSASGRLNLYLKYWSHVRITRSVIVLKTVCSTMSCKYM